MVIMSSAIDSSLPLTKRHMLNPEAAQTFHSLLTPLASTSPGFFKNTCTFCHHLKIRVAGGKFETPNICAKKDVE